MERAFKFLVVRPSRYGKMCIRMKLAPVGIPGLESRAALVPRSFMESTVVDPGAGVRFPRAHGSIVAAIPAQQPREFERISVVEIGSQDLLRPPA